MRSGVGGPQGHRRRSSTRTPSSADTARACGPLAGHVAGRGPAPETQRRSQHHDGLPGRDPGPRRPRRAPSPVTELLEGDVALVLSSLVDHRREAALGRCSARAGHARRLRRPRGVKLPDLFVDHADFIVYGEPEEAIMRLAAGEAHARHRAQPRAAPTSTLCRSRAGTCSGALARRSSWGSWTRPWAGCPCWPAGAARSSAPTARTASWPATARGRWAASSAELEMLCGAATRSLRDLPRSALHPRPRRAAWS